MLFDTWRVVIDMCIIQVNTYMLLHLEPLLQFIGALVVRFRTSVTFLWERVLLNLEHYYILSKRVLLPLESLFLFIGVCVVTFRTTVTFYRSKFYYSQEFLTFYWTKCCYV